VRPVQRRTKGSGTVGSVYLATITGRLSLNRLRDQQARRETYIGGVAARTSPAEDEPEVRARMYLRSALFVLERLSPVERVVFVLRNAFDFTFEEIRMWSDADVVACRKIFQPAHALRVAEDRPRFAVDRARHRALMHSFLEAVRGADVANCFCCLMIKSCCIVTVAERLLPPKSQLLEPRVRRFVIAITRTLSHQSHN